MGRKKIFPGGSDGGIARIAETDHGTSPGAPSRGTIHRDRRKNRTPLCRRICHFRTWQRHLPRRGALRAPRRPAAVSRPERAVDGDGRDRLCQAAIAPPFHVRHFLGRSRHHQHGHRGGDRPHQSPAPAAALRRCIRDAPARSGAAAGRAFFQPCARRQRCLQGGVALLGPHHPSRPDHPVAAGGDRHHA